MGNTLWRLQTVLNISARNAARAHMLGEVEFIVVDWGSDTPLRSTLQLSGEAAGCTRFIEVPQATAVARSGDSPFPEVRALNVAIRRARGKYIGRIDNDTVVAQRFYEQWSAIANGLSGLDEQVDRCVFFARRRCVPFEYASRSPSPAQVDGLVAHWQWVLEIEKLYPFYKSAVGIIIAHRDIWHAVRGYDEEMIYWGWMEVDFVERLFRHGTVPTIDFDDIYGASFCHLEHYDPRRPRVTTRRKNRAVVGPSLVANDDAWGLGDVELLEDRVLAIQGGGFRVDLPRSPSRAKGLIAAIRCSLIRRPGRHLWRLVAPVALRNRLASVRRSFRSAEQA